MQRPMNILNVAMLDIPEAMLRLLEQSFSHTMLATFLEPRLSGRLLGEQKAQLGELDTCYSLSSFIEV